jgi:hypothetical protein
VRPRDRRRFFRRELTDEVPMELYLDADDSASE